MDSKLLSCKVKRPDASLRLICFPWAGGGANQFVTWAKQTPAHIEVVGVQLPGRETRYKEPLSFSAQGVSRDLADVINAHCGDKPFAFFGHSFGALLCQEVAAILKEEYNGLEPVRIYVSGESPPQVARKKARADYVAMTESELTLTLKRMGSVPGHVMQSEEMLKIYLPIMRADLSLVDQLVYDLPKRLVLNPLACPIVYFRALEDNDFDFNAWAQLTSGSFSVHDFPGAHFYMKDPTNVDKILSIVTTDAKDL